MKVTLKLNNGGSVAVEGVTVGVMQSPEWFHIYIIEEDKQNIVHSEYIRNVSEVLYD